MGTSSEVGRLRTVMLHRPGPELQRLTPRNNDKLLFDGIPWVSRAQDEHDAFAQVLRDRDVEVLYLTDLLTESFESADARMQAIELATTSLQLGDTLGTYLRSALADLDPAALTEALTAGLMARTVQPPTRSSRPRGSRPSTARSTARTPSPCAPPRRSSSPRPTHSARSESSARPGSQGVYP